MPSRPTPGGTPRRTATSSGARREVLAMLEDDHKRAKKNFRDFARLDREADADACRRLVEETCAMLKLHTQLEEELLYPAARQALDDEDLIDEAEVEHASAKQLIAQLDKLGPDDAKFAATFTVLGEYVNHHVKEEEKELFPALERTRKIDWPGLCDEMSGRRAELEPQFLAEGEDTDDEADDAPRARMPSAGSGARRTARAEPRPQASGERLPSDDSDDDA